jgi:hypothetical protein
MRVISIRCLGRFAQTESSMSTAIISVHELVRTIGRTTRARALQLWGENQVTQIVTNRPNCLIF